jgi:hypothetical protein
MPDFEKLHQFIHKILFGIHCQVVGLVLLAKLLKPLLIVAENAI